MNILFLIKVIGWVFALGPLSVFLIISFVTLHGIAKDDPLVMSLTLMGLALFLIGFIFLMLVYLTDFIPALVA